MDKKYTIKDIAKLAGVSKGTVDRVLHKRGKVSPLALQKVNEVLSVINYEPNLIARNLKNNKVYHICILLPDPKLDPYWLPCVKGIKDAIQEFKAYNLLIETFYFNPEKTKSFININETIIEKAPDAVLLAPLFHKETLEAIKKYDSLNIIVNTFNNQVESTSIKNFVGQDLFRSGRVAAKLLNTILNKGHIAIIHIDETYKNAIHMQEKERGFRNYFSEKEDPDYKITTLKLKSPNVEVNLKNFINENPDLSGVFITTSRAYQIAKTINEVKDKKIRIIGYDLIDENVSNLNLGIIDFLIHQNQKRQAYLGITYLVDHFLFHKETPEVTLLPIDIINSENADFYLE
ncbi:LacI family DNA-binding transcriptional regulator [Flavobacterium sp. LS1R49]|uniref:LacI family DNA-binding transcriptional regulator n=1 Tax=Flavobacterium shii TaxID=2987687 RepID=A0A9X3C573_9FLAO|nr:LacI family DNA-binding transcriptional regulator [Flavobacterium shii]MCV9929924.1 LacI family DNA-binding transcriptional regulator [Flavobacterium shii]